MHETKILKKSKGEIKLRLSKDDLKGITGRIMPAAQARWFKRFYGVELPHDRQGVILTSASWEALVSAKCGNPANGGLKIEGGERPQVRLINEKTSKQQNANA